MAEVTFVHGVASGDPLTDRVMLWTRVTPPGPVPVEWVMARDPGLADVVATGTTDATPEHDGTVHVDVTGLEPGTTYHYGFRAAGVSSPVGRTRTLPAHPDRLRLAMVSCAKFNAGFFNAYARIAGRDDLDFLLHLGDYIYEASNTPPKSQTPGADIGRAFDPLHECVTLDDYRTRTPCTGPIPTSSCSTPPTPWSRRWTTTSSPTARGATAPPSTGRSTGRGRIGRRTRSGPARSGSRSGAPPPPTPSGSGVRSRSATWSTCS